MARAKLNSSLILTLLALAGLTACAPKTTRSNICDGEFVFHDDAAPNAKPSSGKPTSKSTPAAPSAPDAPETPSTPDAPEESAPAPTRKIKSDGSCLDRALDALKKYSPSGYRTYERVPDKNLFATWISSCDDAETFYLQDVTTAVHETNHAIRAYTGAYHLVSDEMLTVPEATGYFPPQEMANDLAANLGKTDDFFKIYIQPNSMKASSKTDFTYLLDEMNAYTNDVQSELDLTALVSMQDRPASLAAMLTFVAYYASYAQNHHPDVYKKMNTMQMRSALSKLWGQAAGVLKKACDYKNESYEDDKPYTRFLCSPAQTAAMSAILGYPVACPSKCKSTESAQAVQVSSKVSTFSYTR